MCTCGVELRRLALEDFPNQMLPDLHSIVQRQPTDLAFRQTFCWVQEVFVTEPAVSYKCRAAQRLVNLSYNSLPNRSLDLYILRKSFL